MNERIIELAKKAGIKKGKSFVYTTYIELEGHSFSQESLEKFAELIVKECSQFVEDKFDFCGDEIIIAEQSLKHFGVEE